MGEAMALRRAIVQSAAYLDADDYRDNCLIYADLLEEQGEAEAAARRRHKARAFRSPGNRWPPLHELPGLTPHQRQQLGYALARPFSVLSGTPGTGKTYSAAAVVRLVLRRHGRDAVAVCAPTGKAAVRITEVLGRHGAPVRASTIHSLLEIGRNGHDGDGWAFQRHAGRPLDQRFVFVDEVSMLDTNLAADLLAACKPGTHVLLIGDPHQLPPVGHGAPLRDLIGSGCVAHGELSEIQRNAGAIVRACAAIKDGKEFRAAEAYDEATGDNLVLMERADPAQQVECLGGFLGCLDHYIQRLDPNDASMSLDPVWDVQVLVAINKGNPVARRELNQRLQAQLNPTGQQAEGNPFRAYDKIICTKNGWHPTNTREGRAGPEVYVANGEQGKVVVVQPRLAIAVFPHRPPVRIPMGKPRRGEGQGEDDEGGAGCDFDLGYAITCHKAQGSEWPVVVVMADASYGARQICGREWVYTAISRASNLCVLIGRDGVLQQMAKRPALAKRRTFLVEDLRNGDREEAAD